MIQVINRALNILEVIANNSDKELGLAEIADEVELNHGTWYRSSTTNMICYGLLAMR